MSFKTEVHTFDPNTCAEFIPGVNQSEILQRLDKTLWFTKSASFST